MIATGPFLLAVQGLHTNGVGDKHGRWLSERRESVHVGKWDYACPLSATLMGRRAWLLHCLTHSSGCLTTLCNSPSYCTYTNHIHCTIHNTHRKFLNHLVSKACSLLSKLFFRIMATNAIPKMWRKAKEIAIEKPGKDPKVAENYWPISLLSVCLKLLECLAHGRISETVEDILSPDQAGFHKEHSTCDQVAALTTYNEQGFQLQLKTGTVFLDLTATYDTVWHTGLLKLSRHMPYCFVHL